MNRILLFCYTAVPQLPRSNRYTQFTPRARSAGSAGLMPTEARGNYLPEAPYLRQTKTYLNCNSRMHDCQHNTTMSVQFSSSLSQRPIFSFFVADVMSNYLTTDGLKKFSPLPEAPLRPEARGICHICHMVNPALSAGDPTRQNSVVASGRVGGVECVAGAPFAATSGHDVIAMR